MITWVKNVNNFRIAKFYLIFCQFQPGIAYKSAAYKKKRVVEEDVSGVGK